MLNRIKRTIFASILLASGGVFAQARAADEPLLQSLASNSDFIFQGTVTKIEYANSIDDIPHTFVTYRVADVVKGAYAPKTITLRFIGGIEKRGNVIRKLTASNTPRFETGQESLMMVADNGIVQCPLVRCAEGRFRFSQGRVLTEVGGIVAEKSAGGSVILSGANAQAAAAGRQVRLSDNQVATPMNQARFVSIVRSVVASQGAAASRSTSIQSIDPSKPFRGPLPAVSGPPR